VLERAEMLVIATAGPYLIALQRPRVLVCAMDLAHCEALWTLKVSKLSLIIFAGASSSHALRVKPVGLEGPRRFHRSPSVSPISLPPVNFIHFTHFTSFHIIS